MSDKKLYLCTWSKSVHYEKGVIYDLSRVNRYTDKPMFFDMQGGKMTYIPEGLNVVYATFEKVEG